jgi:hypothetical protein
MLTKSFKKIKQIVFYFIFSCTFALSSLKGIYKEEGVYFT